MFCKIKTDLNGNTLNLQYPKNMQYCIIFVQNMIFVEIMIYKYIFEII